MTTKYYLVDAAEGKQTKKNFEDLLSSVNQRARKNLDALKSGGYPLNVKFRRIVNLEEDTREIYAFVFADEHGAI